MSTLNSLKLVNSKKPTAIPPILHRRNKLVAFPRFGRQLILSTMNQGSSDEANQIHR